jgi:hypothetical protein
MDNKEIAFERTCRYGHGPLMLHAPLNGADDYHFPTHKNVYTEGPTNYGVLVTPPILTLKVWRCVVCGYIELFDAPEASNG